MLIGDLRDVNILQFICEPNCFCRAIFVIKYSKLDLFLNHESFLFMGANILDCIQKIDLPYPYINAAPIRQVEIHYSAEGDEVIKRRLTF